MNYHLVGAGGVGMSALAQLMLSLGCPVSGSDRYLDSGRELDIFRKLRALGMELVPQDGSGVRAGTAAVVVSSAIEEDNPDISAARALGIPVVHRAAMLAELARGRRCIAVTGTAGKSTVTGMIGWVLTELGLDPAVVNGAPVLNWVSDRHPGNFRFGRSGPWVLELDESDRSLLHFHPDLAVITNVSKDHFELEEVRRIFATFARQVKEGVIGCNPLEASGIPEPGFEARVSAEGIAFDYGGARFQLPLMGRHNAENALHCVKLCERLGLDLRKVSAALEKFGGIERRLQVVGRPGGVTVIDDYAHNPAKIAAAWGTVAPLCRRLSAVWRPHGYGPLALMRRELEATFSSLLRPADRLFIMEAYFAGGTAGREVTGRMLADDLKLAGNPVEYAAGYDELMPALLSSAAGGGAVLFMGARDPDLPVFARGLVLKLDDLFMHRAPGSGGVAQENQPTEKAHQD